MLSSLVAAARRCHANLSFIFLFNDIYDFINRNHPPASAVDQPRHINANAKPE